ncbi:hypothetical protein COM54_15525 [Bacillus toyonensis]|uniref:hypothetical protein n=1 Tax=Bacillus toyonensis TaxID=155322 RepID=UPI000BF7BBE4|nr:hypothetical protein [Bacillus toyonensis]PGE10201.1 hypothetical protein COM54_15525 [Bacillus toyonensis]
MNNKIYRFKQKMTVTDPLRVFFLCGTKFIQKDPNDKRKVLKKHIESKYKENYKAIILEENFIFGKTNKNYLSYDKIFMKNLKDIELLTGLYSDKIFIIHESISTAAELGMFASDEKLLKKTCLITPDSFSMEEDKLSSFIRLAFFHNKSLEENIRNITFYPKVKENIVSNSKTDYYTYFPKNKIPKNLALKIDTFIKENDTKNLEIVFKKNRYNKKFTGANIISYYFTNTNLNVVISSEAIRILLISIFSLKHFKAKIRKCSTIIKTVDTLETEFKLLITNSISEIEAIDFSSHKINISIDISPLNLRTVIGYFLYLLQALDMIKLPVKEQSEFVQIHSQFTNLLFNYSNTIEEISKSKLTDIL